MPYENQDHTHKIASGRFESKCMRHSPAFDIVVDAGSGSADRVFGMDGSESSATHEVRRPAW
jgi:hypothetical protein